MYYFLHRVLSLCTHFIPYVNCAKKYSFDEAHNICLLPKYRIYKYADLLLFITQRETYPHKLYIYIYIFSIPTRSMWKTWNNVFINAVRLHYVICTVLCISIYYYIHHTHRIHLECIHRVSSVCAVFCSFLSIRIKQRFCNACICIDLCSV